MKPITVISWSDLNAIQRTLRLAVVPAPQRPRRVFSLNAKIAERKSPDSASGSRGGRPGESLETSLNQRCRVLRMRRPPLDRGHSCVYNLMINRFFCNFQFLSRWTIINLMIRKRTLLCFYLKNSFIFYHSSWRELQMTFGFFQLFEFLKFSNVLFRFSKKQKEKKTFR